jgi:hypothetical protein
MNMDRVLQSPGFLGQLAGERITRVFIDPVENIKID